MYTYLTDIFFVSCQRFQNHGKNCWENVVCARCNKFPIQDRDLMMWKYASGNTWVSSNYTPWLSVLGFKILIFWTWECCFWSLTWWFSEFYLQQRHQDRLLRQYDRGGTSVGGNWPSLSYVFGFEIFVSHTWKGWFWKLTWWFLDTINDESMFPLHGFIILVIWCKGNEGIMN